MMDFTEAVSIQHPGKNKKHVSTWSKPCCCFGLKNSYWTIHVGRICWYLLNSHRDKYLFWLFLHAMVRSVQFCGLTSCFSNILFRRLRIADPLPCLPKISHIHFPVVLCSRCALAFGALVIIAVNVGIFFFLIMHFSVPNWLFWGLVHLKKGAIVMYFILVANSKKTTFACFCRRLLPES